MNPQERGLDCQECRFYQTSCNGCRAVEGRPFWTDTGCELFICCSEKAYYSCGDCPELPCKQFTDLKDPNISDEEHLKELDKRVKRLRSNLSN